MAKTLRFQIRSQKKVSFFIDDSLILLYWIRLSIPLAALSIQTEFYAAKSFVKESIRFLQGIIK